MYVPETDELEFDLRQYKEIASSLPRITNLTVYREVEAPYSDVFDPCRSAVTTLSVQKDFLRLRRGLRRLHRFDVKITSTPPFHLNPVYHRLTAEQRHLVVERDGKGYVVRSIDVERIEAAIRNAASGPEAGYWQDQLIPSKWRAAKAFEFSWDPDAPLCTGLFLGDPSTMSGDGSDY